MKVRLMYEERDFKLLSELSPEEESLIQDGELDEILSAMAQGDKLIYSVCRTALLRPLQSPEELGFRQEILRDALENKDALRALYKICLDWERRRQSSWYTLGSNRVSALYSGAVELINICLAALEEMKKLSARCAGDFSSRGFRGFFSMLEEELSDAYLSELRGLMRELNTDKGVLVSARFGSFLQGTDYVYLRKSPGDSRLRWLMAPAYVLGERDDAGAADIFNRRERALREPATALARSARHMVDFFERLKTELSFYIGALNLKEAIEPLPLCMPELKREKSWRGLYDGSMALKNKCRPVGNDMEPHKALLTIISGANQGGKTTFLRSIAQGRLMAQSGLFVFAEGFAFPLRGAVYSHFKREEEGELKNGKLQEELGRMEAIAEKLRPGDLVLLNESLSSTNEPEGSEILRGITRALKDKGIELFSVSHLMSYIESFKDSPDTLFLRAERLPDGQRSYKILQAPPLETAYGEDIYRKIFGK